MRNSIAVVTALGCAAVGFSAVSPNDRPLVFNLSPSVPVGLYGRSRTRPQHGDYVLVRLPFHVGAMAHARGYLPSPLLLIKRVAGQHGRHACRLGSRVWIRGYTWVWARRTDSSGRALPNWQGCQRLRPGQLFVLGPHADSFDSRYFGPVDSKLVVARLLPLLIF